MKLLVTGGLGFIGSNFIRYYREKHPSHFILNIDLCTYAGNPENLKDIQGGARYRWVRADIAEPEAVDRLMRGMDAVIHFAAESHVDRSILDANSFLRTNVLGTQALLSAALRHKVRRFVHVSSDEVYGSVARGHSRESHPLLPNSPYAASKAASDLLVRSFVVTYGLPAIITRSSNNFGPYQHPEKAIPLMITNWMEGLPFPLYGDGLNVRDWIYVLDHVRALELVLRKGRPGEIYNIGGTLSANNLELVERIRGLMGVDRALVRRVLDRPGHDRRYALDCRKLQGLGWRHTVPFEKALRSTVAWYRDNRAWWQAIKGGRGFKSYYRKQYRVRSAGSSVGS